MRQQVPRLLPLFRSEMQMRLLGLLLLDTEREWTIAALQRAVDAPRPSVHRELRRALDAGLVVSDTSARPYRYRGAAGSPAAAPLRNLLRVTVGLEIDLQLALREEPDVQIALIHGSWAAGRVTPASDVDLLVVGTTDFDALGRRLARIGRQAGREVDMTLFTPKELSRERERDSGFLRKVLGGPVIQLKGDLPRPEGR